MIHIRAVAPRLTSLDTRIVMSHETYGFWRTTSLRRDIEQCAGLGTVA